MIRESVREKLRDKLNESTGFSAKRAIIDIAQGLSRQFETDIIKTLNIQNPDSMSPELQRQYLVVVEKMKEDFVKSAIEATRKLIAFPKNEDKE